MDKRNLKAVAVIVAHPDDETLWAGGTILSHPAWQWFIACLCRGSDKDRAPKFFKALQVLGAEGTIGDMDDGPEQNPLNEKELEHKIMELLPQLHFDLIISHNPNGEYTKHVRHEEISKAVIKLWYAGEISADELWTFAYEDGNKGYYPKPIKTANFYHILTWQIWLMTKSGIARVTEAKKSGLWEQSNQPKISFEIPGEFDT